MNTATRLKIYYTTHKRDLLIAALPVVAIVLVASYVLLTKAAGSIVSIQAETGTKSAQAIQVSDTSASNSNAVRFTAPSSSGTRCAPYPSFPDASCTGPVGTLTAYTGDTTFSTAGQVVQNVVITDGFIRVAANNVTFRNVKFVYSGPVDTSFALVYLNPEISGTTFENCEVDGKDAVQRGILAAGDGVSIKNCNIHNTGHGVEFQSSVDIIDSYLHDISSPGNFDWHADAVLSADGGHDINVIHNTIKSPTTETSNISITSETGSFTNVLVKNNLMAGSGYSTYAGSAIANTNFRYIDNHFSTQYYPTVGYWGIWAAYASSVVRTGNVIHETGVAANQ